MSKNHREARKPELADWTVREISSIGTPSVVARARMVRDEHGGYTFTDDHGTVADYPPGTVLSVTRAEPAEPRTEVHVHVDGPDIGKVSAAVQKDLVANARRNPGGTALRVK